MKEPKLDLVTLEYVKKIMFDSRALEDYPLALGYQALCDKIKELEIEKIANRENLEEKLFEFECYLVGKKPSEITIGNDFWKEDNTISKEVYKQFKGFAILLIRKILHINKSKAELAFDKFYKQFGLRIRE